MGSLCQLAEAYVPAHRIFAVLRGGQKGIVCVAGPWPKLVRADFSADANSFAARFPLTPDQSRALVQLDVPAMVKMGVHPLVAFLANMQVQRDAR